MESGRIHGVVVAQRGDLPTMLLVGGCGPAGWVAASDDQEDAESRLRQVAAAVAVKQFVPLRTADHVTLRQPLQADVTDSLA